MLAAYPELDVGTRLATALDADFDEFADAFLIDRNEGVFRENAARGVDAEEGTRVVARNAKTRLGKVIGAEGEEFGGLRDLVGLQARAG